MSETDRRLKDHLNTNQARRERMCLEILQVLAGFTDVKPRLPKGGPDGGRDMEARYDGRALAFRAVGFVNDATDTDEHRRKAESKFKEDLERAANHRSEIGDERTTVFVFFTNVGLTPGIVSDLRKAAYDAGMTVCEIYDRERLRTVLDSTKGYAIRLRYLDIPLSDPEQKEFFSTWGDELQRVMSSGLGEIEASTRRTNFLLESEFAVDTLHVVVRLKKPLGEIDGGHHLFQVHLGFRPHVDGLLGLNFGSGSESIVETLDQVRASPRQLSRNRAYRYGFAWLVPGTPQHEAIAARRRPDIKTEGKEDEGAEWFEIYKSHGVLEIDRTALHIQCGSEPFLMRLGPAYQLRNLHRCMIVFDCNRALGENIVEIVFFASRYELLRLTEADFRLQEGSFDRFKLPENAKQTADSADWCQIRPTALSSCFEMDFMSRTPKRF